MNILTQIKGISSAKENKATVILGRIGSGKTFLAGTYPKPMLYVSIGSDGGDIILKRFSDDEVKLLELHTSEDVPVYLKVKELLDELYSINNGPYKSVVIDPWSLMEEDYVAWLIKQKKGVALSLPERGVVGQQLLQVRNAWIRNSRMNECEYVLTAHVKTREDVDNITGEKSVGYIPQMSVTNGNLLLQKANNVMYCCRKTVILEDGTREVRFLTYIGAHPNIDTKFRTPYRVFEGVGTYFSDCDYAKIQELSNTTAAIPKQNFTVVDEDIPVHEDDPIAETPPEQPAEEVPPKETKPKKAKTEQPADQNPFAKVNSQGW